MEHLFRSLNTFIIELIKKNTINYKGTVTVSLNVTKVTLCPWLQWKEASQSNLVYKSKESIAKLFFRSSTEEVLEKSNRNSTRNSIQAAFSNNPWEPSGRHTRLLATTLPWPKILSFWVIYIITNPRNYFAGRGQLSMHCLEIGMTKYISLSSVIARKLNFQAHLLKNNAF